MNLYIKKISFLCLSLAFLFMACETEETIEITSPDPAFVLQQPGISNVFLNFGTPDNSALTLSWNDEVTGGSSYDVEMALSSDFATIVNLGNSNGSSFSISVQDLNTAIRNAGASTYRDIAIYLRVNSGGTFSNSVLYLISTFPTEVAMITSPMANDAFVLALSSSSDVAMTVSWTDAVLASDLGIDIDYTIEAAAAGTDFASVVAVGTSTSDDDTTMEVTHSDLNAVAIGAGLTADVAGDVDMRIVAKNTNTNGNILERISEVITVSITPYNVSFPNLFLVGDATTPGWNPDNNNTPIFRYQNVPNGYFFTGYFNAGAFKLLETTAWQPQWGTNDGSTLAVNLGGGSDPGTFNVGTAGYYTYTFTTVGEGGSFTVTPYDASGATTYTTMGIIGQAIGGWGDGDEVNFTQDVNNPHLWYATSVNFTKGDEFLVRANDNWDDGVYRNTGSTELYGTASLDGSNFSFIGDTGSYDVWFNDLDGGYIILPND